MIMATPGPTDTVRIGATNLTVTRICFGTSPLGGMPGTYGYDVDAERAKDTIRAIFDGPTNFIDTSRNYGFGRSEKRIGEVIAERGGLPDGFVVSTKLDRDPDTNGFDAAQARRSIEQSLGALGLDRIHLLHLHDPEYARSMREVGGPGGSIAELFTMKEEGLADAVGLAAGNVDVMMPIVQEWDFDALITHNRFTLANRNAEALMDLAHAKGIAVLNAAPYAGGVLAKGPASFRRYVYQEASDEMLGPIRHIEAVCVRHGVPLGAAALQFSMRDPRVTSTICGVSKPERIAETLEWAQWPIPDAMWDELLALPFSVADPEAARDYKAG
jgi:D-threo-aldose 1-dehydrogenase